MTCRYCDRKRIRARACKHVDVCAKCHEYLYCEGKPPRNQWARFFDEGTAETLAASKGARAA